MLTEIINNSPMNQPPRVDRNALRFNQASIIAGVALAFVLGGEAGRWVVLGVAFVMLLGTAVQPLSLFKQVYRQVFVRFGVLSPAPVIEDPVPHQFAQGMGGVVLLLAFAALAAGAETLGWLVSLVVVVLAAVNLLVGFCMGCFIYLQLQTVGLVRRGGGAH